MMFLTDLQFHKVDLKIIFRKVEFLLNPIIAAKNNKIESTSYCVITKMIYCVNHG